MSQTFLSPDRLYDRPWRSGHPFNRSPSAKRRWTMLLIFTLLCTIIGGYLWITDARRVKAMAESELSKLTGGTVTVGRAKLSLFEGLSLEYVNVYVDNNGDPDSLLFSAKQFLVSYDPSALLTGQLKLTQIVAIDPHVQLTENLDTARWNYQRMTRPTPATSKPSKSGRVPTLPEVILRNAQVDYAEIRDGLQTSSGTMNIEGQFAPSSDGQRFTFEMQSRGGNGTPNNSITMGPTVTGVLVRTTGQVTAQLRDFQFGKDIRSMLPAQVRTWWDQHDLAGSVDIPKFIYTPAAPGREAKFEVQTMFKKVNLTVRPEEWMSRDELKAQQLVGVAFNTMRDAGLNTHGVVDRLAGLVEPSPIDLGEVEGAFIFTEDGIVIGERDGDGKLVQAVSGVLEENKFAIDGHIEGYSPLSPAAIHINSTRTQIPAQPRYITSMPGPVRELYDHLRPQGLCTLQVSLDRPGLGGRLQLAGGVNIIDGNFVFDRFPYPVRAATGKIVFGHDERSDMDQIKLVDLRGKGALGGPNSQSIIKLSGLIGPLTSDVGVNVTVSSDDVHDEPTLTAAFPPEVKEALRNLDADGKGLYPKFKGGFECRINRPIGPKSIWVIDTDVTLNDAAGKMVVFPYLMEHVTGRLAIREGYMDILGATMKKDDSSLVIEGRVTWRAGVGGKALEPGEVTGAVTKPRPDLKITARNVPIDKDLLAALPEDRRAWLQKVGLTGSLDIDGRVWRPAPGGADVARSESGSELTHAFDLNLHNGTIWPMEGTFAISSLAGKLRLLPDRMIINEMTGKRGAADLAGRGEVSWPDNKPNVFFSGTASKLELDRTLYRILPAGAQSAWDAVKPEGVVDLDLSYNGSVGVDDRAATQVNVAQANAAPTTIASNSPSTTPASLQARSSQLSNLDLIIHPVKLAATVQAMPYRLDDITGTVRLSGGKVTLTDLAGKHDAATIRVAGSGSMERTDWGLRLSADKVKVDDAFRKALPGGLASLVDSLKLTGTIGFDFSKLDIRGTPADRVPTTHPATTSPDSPPLDVDFAVKLGLDDGTIGVGVPMTQMNGKLDFQGDVRANKLGALSGPIDLLTMKIAGRSAQDVHAEFFKPADADALRIGKITGGFCDGEIAGLLDLGFPDTGPQRYVMSLVLRNADLKAVSGMTDQNLSGELSASLAVEGDWSDPRSRRGRGDVAVNGKEMYKIPLVLGLLQITNLSLPITSPFNEGSARYNVDGQTVTFESLELRSHDMLMSGEGKLDFNTKKVSMSFTTDNPNWPKVPILGDIVQTAKHELLQIHVKGTLEDPKINAGNTVTTTVDEVLRSDRKTQTADAKK